MQFSTKDYIGICRKPLTFDKGVTVKEPVLPQSYSTVPAVALNAALTAVPQRSFSGTLDRANVREEGWLKQVRELLKTELKDKQISCAAYHASLQSPIVDQPAIIALLPLFFNMLTHQL